MQVKLAKPSPAWMLIILLALAKLLIHLFTMHNYVLHRDAYLYYALGEHLQWGYVAVPPSIALFSNIFTGLFGNTVFALRLVPAIVGAVNMIIIGLMVRELNGKRIAILLAGLAYLLGPAYLHVNALFQPVSFNHFYWLLSAYLILLMIKSSNPKIWIWIGLAFGLGFLNKYSIVFFYAAFALALLISKHRKLYLSKYFLIGVLTGFVIILPNLIWQFNHNWPVLYHMKLLRESQLVHVNPLNFLFDQLLMNAPALLIWLGGLIFLIFVRNESRYRLFGFLFLLIILLLLFGSGKSYYTLGIYPVLFVFGAYFIEKYLNRKTLIPVTLALIILMVGGLVFSFRIDGIPFLKPQQVARENAFRWEDGQMHDLPQDMADMMGWDEIAAEAIGLYQSLSPEEQSNCSVICEHYGQAGALMFYGKGILPEPISFNGSFAMWAPDSLQAELIIGVLHDSYQDNNMDSVLNQWFKEVEIHSILRKQYFRESGTRIVLGRKPSGILKEAYRQEKQQARERYGL